MKTHLFNIRMPDGNLIRVVDSEKRAETLLKRVNGRADISSSGSYDVVKDGERVVDIKNVEIEGYLSTFKGTTASDRDGDYVEPGAFTETIPKFMKNPVLLVNHSRDVAAVAGQFLEMREDARGLWFRARLSDGPHMIHTRFLVAEGHLKTVSMGGVFYYSEDGRGIRKVDLYEGSLVPIPANPDCLISVREA